MFVFSIISSKKFILKNDIIILFFIYDDVKYDRCLLLLNLKHTKKKRWLITGCKTIEPVNERHICSADDFVHCLRDT